MCEIHGSVCLQAIDPRGRVKVGLTTIVKGHRMRGEVQVDLSKIPMFPSETQAQHVVNALKSVCKDFQIDVLHIRSDEIFSL